MSALKAQLGESSWSYTNAGRQNATVADAVPGTPNGIDGLLSQALPGLLKSGPERVTHIAMNWGVNDMPVSGLVEATWESQYGQIIAYLHARFPNAVMYVAYPWRKNFDTDATTMHGWVDQVVANCAGIGATCHAGPDEVVVIKDGDNGAIETDAGGVHYTNPYGVGVYAAAVKAVLGY